MNLKSNLIYFQLTYNKCNCSRSNYNTTKQDVNYSQYLYPSEMAIWCSQQATGARRFNDLPRLFLFTDIRRCSNCGRLYYLLTHVASALHAWSSYADVAVYLELVNDTIMHIYDIDFWLRGSKRIVLHGRKHYSTYLLSYGICTWQL